MSTNSGKRNRWGDRSSDGDQPISVSEKEALDALLATSNAEKESRGTSQRQYDKRPRRDDNRHRDGRSGPNGGRGKRETKKQDGQDYSYYGRDDGDDSQAKGTAEEAEPVDKAKPDFGLSGTLSKERVGEFKFREPPEARAPNTRWRLYVFKNDEAIETLHVSRQSAFLFGRNPELADILLLHPSASGQHAVLQYRALPGKDDGRLCCKPYLMDLESTNGSFLNGVKLDPARYYELRKGDVLKFGASTREFVLLTENTTSIN